jgi:hypothetical protein
MTEMKSGEMEVELELPAECVRLSPEEVATVRAYLAQLTPREAKAYAIAKAALGTSFSVVKANGYLRYCKERGI